MLTKRTFIFTLFIPLLFLVSNYSIASFTFKGYQSPLAISNNIFFNQDYKMNFILAQEITPDITLDQNDELINNDLILDDNIDPDSDTSKTNTTDSKNEPPQENTRNSTNNNPQDYSNNTNDNTKPSNIDITDYSKNSDRRNDFNMQLGISLGLSGATMFIWLIDAMAEANGELAKHFDFNGEFGIYMDMNFLFFGAQIEGFYGTYQILAEPFPRYTMFGYGLTPYLLLGNFMMGPGMGYFHSEYNKDFSGIIKGRYYEGVMYWFLLGYKASENIELNIRFRYQRLIKRNQDYDGIIDDYVFLFRINVGFNLI